jgi:hypothetical protein
MSVLVSDFIRKAEKWWANIRFWPAVIAYLIWGWVTDAEKSCAAEKAARSRRAKWREARAQGIWLLHAGTRDGQWDFCRDPDCREEHRRYVPFRKGE